MGDAGAKSVTKLRRELEIAQKDLGGLAKAFADAGSASERIDITKKIRKQRSEISELKKTLSALDLAPDLAKAGTAGGQSLGIAAAAAAAAAAPAIGATISAAIIGGAGIGGVIGGVALAARDARVKAAGTQLGQTLMGQLEQSASVFVNPVLQSIAKVEARFTMMRGRIDRIFDTSSGFLGPLVSGALDGVDGILRGFDRLVTKGRPVIDALGRAFGTVGGAVGDAFEIIAGGSENAADAINDIAQVMAAAIKATAWLVRGLTDLYAIVSYIPNKLHGFSVEMGKLVGINDAASKSVAAATAETVASAEAIIKTGAAAAGASPQVRDLDQAFRDATTAARGLYGATTDAAGALANANKVIEENGRGVSLNSEKGRANRKVLEDVANAYVRVHDSAVASNGENGKSAKISDTNRASFIALAIKAGYAADKAAALATKLGLIPSRRETQIKVETAKAEANVKRQLELLAKVRSKTVSVSVLINDAKLNNVENRLSRLHGEGFNAGAHWAAFDANSGVARTGGPVPVSLSNNITVSLDGQPFYSIAAQASRDRSDRDAWRQKVGRR